MPERSLSEIDWASLTDPTRSFFPSPAAWEDEVLYFLMLDRFSHNREKNFVGNDGGVVTGPDDGRPPFDPAVDEGNAIGTPDGARQWREAGTRFVGGTLKGLTSKLGYLKRLGVTAVWISPVLKQVKSQETYHGYGSQDLLDVDPRFGTRDDFRDMVKTAHDNGIRVVLDIILNHSGDVFDYSVSEPNWNGSLFDVRGYRDKDGSITLPFERLKLTQHAGQFPDGAIWPHELQEPATFTRKGRISNFDFDPEFREGDFFVLKDITLGQGPIDDYRPSAALLDLCDIYKFWIAFADLDGFRVDTVKHMDLGAARFLAAVIHEFAQSLGKENFYLIAEITGGREFAFDTLEVTGLDAALGISDEPGKLEGTIKGDVSPENYFDIFRNSLLVRKDSHVWFRNKVVSNFNDHDMVRQGGDHKARFCADNLGRKLMLNALALQVTTLGIPTIYYGSEQQFDGQGGKDLPEGETQGHADRWIRESMFGGGFGAFQSRDRHFFKEDAAVYQELAKILAIRKSRIGLRRGRQFLREISGNGVDFGFPRKLDGRMRSIVPWSRIFNDREMLLAINTDDDNSGSARVIVDFDLHASGDSLKCIYSTDAAQIGQDIFVQAIKGKVNGNEVDLEAVLITVPAAGFVIFE